MKSLTEKIRLARKQSGLSQSVLGKEIGLTDKSISAYELGRSHPPLDKLKSLARVTGFPLQYFIDEDIDNSLIMQKLTLVESEIKAIRDILKGGE